MSQRHINFRPGETVSWENHFNGMYFPNSHCVFMIIIKNSTRPRYQWFPAREQEKTLILIMWITTLLYLSLWWWWEWFNFRPISFSKYQVNLNEKKIMLVKKNNRTHWLSVTSLCTYNHVCSKKKMNEANPFDLRVFIFLTIDKWHIVCTSFYIWICTNWQMTDRLF